MVRYGLLVFVIFMNASCFGKPAEEPSPKNEDTYEYLKLFGNVVDFIRKNYVEDVSVKSLIQGAIKGMFESLDPHSMAIDAVSLEKMQEEMGGTYGGVGLEVSPKDGIIEVISALDGSPAEKAGIKSKDLISFIDGTSVKLLGYMEGVNRMRGKVDTNVTLTIQRDGQTPFNVTLSRKKLDRRSISGRLEGDVIYLRISTFMDKTGHEKLKAKFIELRDSLKDKKPTGIIMDLRNNPGGVLEEAIAVVDLFLDRGEVVTSRGRDPKSTRRYEASGGDISNNLPMVVLINGGTASAPEIVAGAFKDHNRAVLVGEKTFGKGSVQTVMPVQEAKKLFSAFRITTARYYTPSGVSIQAKGIEPDIHVPLGIVEEISGPSFGEVDLPKSLKNTQAPAEPKKEPAKENPSLAEAIKKDYQLQSGINVLRTMVWQRKKQKTH